MKWFPIFGPFSNFSNHGVGDREEESGEEKEEEREKERRVQSRHGLRWCGSVDQEGRP